MVFEYVFYFFFLNNKDEVKMWWGVIFSNGTIKMVLMREMPLLLGKG